ncbi:dihydrofolate reductase family protein [Vallitalea okinawensis]|uniref:dihydrofolate reductase family protein n=1 Tax=Vallitalea okinawensis TaxID=2078660 RepID=UPI000CFDE129|nr:dihydrofolate reductase family protein [Vallitalea okinawensis]
MKRKIILNLAMSLDGYIATEEGKYDWIHGDGNNHLDTEEKFSFGKFLDRVDTMVMGKKSYDDCDIEPFKNKEIYIVTHKQKENFDNVKFISGNVVECIKNEQKEQGKDIYLFGGGLLIDQFIKANVIDEYMVAIIPTVLGKGRPLFLDNNPQIPLHLENYFVEEGIVILHYTKQ